jgi:Apea-like HEPN
MTYRNPKLQKSIKSYVMSAIRLVAKAGDRKFPYADWSGAPEFPFLFRREDLEKLPEYESCLEVISHDSIVTAHIDQMVGIEGRRSRSGDFQSLMIRLPHLGVYKNRIRFNRTHFEREYRALEAAFYESDFEYEVIVPLRGVTFNTAIRLEEDLEVCRVNRNDLTRLTKTEIDEDQFLGGPLWAIRTQYKLPKIVGDNKKIVLENTERNDATRDAVNATIHHVLACLRFCGLSQIFPFTIVHRTRSWLFADLREYVVKVPAIMNVNFTVPEGFNKDFIKTWKRLQDKRLQQMTFISQALKRFSYAHERHDWEDRIIDLLIAAEALFLSQSMGELSYRLRLNAAMFLGNNLGDRQQIFEDMGLAYELRSKIVHGASAHEVVKKIKKREPAALDEKYRLDTFTFRIQEYVRVAIHKMLEIAFSKQQHSKKMINWEELLMRDR